MDDEIRLKFIAEQAALLVAARRERVEELLTGCRNLVRFLIAQRDQRTGADTEMEELQRQRAASKIRQWTDKESKMHHTHIALDPVRGAKFNKALADMVRRHRKTETNAGVPWDQLQVDAFLNGIDRAVTTRDPATPRETSDTVDAAGEGPQTGAPSVDADAGCGDDFPVVGQDAAVPTAGASGSCGCGHQRDDRTNPTQPPATPMTDLRIPEIGVLIDQQSLLDGLHEHSICETYDGVAVPISEVRRLCCEADIIPYVLNGKGEVTDLGRSTRTVSRAQRRKLRAMHKTCVGDGCGVGFEQCEIHHVIFWRFTGRSDI